MVKINEFGIPIGVEIGGLGSRSNKSNPDPSILTPFGDFFGLNPYFSGFCGHNHECYGPMNDFYGQNHNLY